MFIPIQYFPTEYTGMYVGTAFMLILAILIIWNVITIGSFRSFIRGRETLYNKRIEIMEKIVKEEVRQILTALKKTHETNGMG